MTLIEALTGRRKSSRERVYEIARAEAGGKAKADDAATLDALLREAHMGESEYTATVDICRRHLASRKAAEAQPRTLKALLAVRDAVNTKHVERRETEARLAEELREAEQRLADAARAHAAAEREAQTADALEVDHPAILGVEPKDLDLFDLRWADNLINARDESAPVLGVSREVWQRETERRGRIRRNATARAHAEHRASIDAWVARRESVWSRALDFDEPPPGPFEMPTWADIVARGWNRTLDDAGDEAA